MKRAATRSLSRSSALERTTRSKPCMSTCRKSTRGRSAKRLARERPESVQSVLTYHDNQRQLRCRMASPHDLVPHHDWHIRNSVRCSGCRSNDFHRASVAIVPDSKRAIISRSFPFSERCAKRWSILTSSISTASRRVRLPSLRAITAPALIHGPNRRPVQPHKPRRWAPHSRPA